MNGNFYQNPTFPSAINPDTKIENNDNFNSTNYQNNIESVGNSLTLEQSYIENILRLNKGKKVKVYVSFPDSSEWKDKVFSGVIEQAGRDHLIISDPSNGNWYMILMIYLNYVEFDESINYSYPFTE